MSASKPFLERYPLSVEEGSQSGHCCFSTTVVDDEGENICECLDADEARLIAHSLNTLALGIQRERNPFVSALTPHIRVLRAEAATLQEEAAEAVLIAPRSPVHVMLQRMAMAKRIAADRLEASEPKLREDEHPITYDPKGKR